MAMHTVQTIIRDVARRGTSRYGNPTLTIHTDSGEYITQANTSWAYEADNPEWRDASVTLHLNRYGNVRWATRDTD